jgi:hypothetical protein
MDVAAASPPVTAVAAMREQVQQRAGSQEKQREQTEEVGGMLSDQEEAGNKQERHQHPGDPGSIGDPHGASPSVTRSTGPGPWSAAGGVPRPGRAEASLIM